MGYSISWLAIQGQNAESVCEKMGLKQTGQFEEIPDASNPLYGCQLPSEHYLIFANDCEFASQQKLAELSQLGELVSCSAEEHTMASASAGWSNGKIVWSIDHDSYHGLEHLQTIGKLPPMFAEIRDRLLTQQAHEDEGGTDYVFDIAIEVAQELTGFRHDQEIPGLSEKPFEILLEPAKKRGHKKRKPQAGESKKAWWQFWK